MIQKKDKIQQFSKLVRDTMPQIKTAERILEFLKEQDKAVTPTAIYKKLGAAYNSVLAIVDTLEKWGYIETVTDGRICLVRFKDGNKNGYKGYNGYEFGHNETKIMKQKKSQEEKTITENQQPGETSDPEEGQNPTVQ